MDENFRLKMKAILTIDWRVTDQQLTKDEAIEMIKESIDSYISRLDASSEFNVEIDWIEN